MALRATIADQVQLQAGQVGGDVTTDRLRPGRRPAGRPGPWRLTGVTSRGQARFQRPQGPPCAIWAAGQAVWPVVRR